MRDFRKHAGWYMSGYPVGPEVRRRFSMVGVVEELEDVVAGLDPTARDRAGAASGSSAATPTVRSGSACPTGGSTVTSASELLDDVTVPQDDDVMALSGG